MSEQRDDFDLEVSRLAALPATPPSPAANSESEHVAPPSNASEDGSPEPLARHVSVTERRPRRQRLLRGGSIVVLLTLLIAAVLLLPTGNRDALLHLLIAPTPVPTATPQAGNDAFLWEHSVPWGRLFIDHKPGPDVSGSTVHRSTEGLWEGAAFHLGRGRHVLEYRAAPFATLDCVVSVPVSTTDTCPLARSVDFAFLVPNAPATRLLDLQATIDRLPSAQVDALVESAQAALKSRTASLPAGTLLQGDHYLDSTGQLTQATTTLLIQLQVRLESSVDNFGGLPCVTLCTTGGLFPGDSPAEAWPVQAAVALSWRYTTTAGLLKLANGPASLVGTSPITLITLLTRWQDGSWQTPAPVFGARETDEVICSTGGHALEVLRAIPAQTTVDQTFQAPYVALTAELGCLLAGSATDPTTGKATGPIALVLYRAGALVAVNAQAQHDFPTLPLASAHERALAQAVAPTSLS